jgi:U3 small nucleolar RNA-associated protein 18
VLAVASKYKKDAMRLIHVPTGTVFSNWPSSKTPLHSVSTVSFSPGSGYLAIGNDRGRVLLYRMLHYQSA